MRVTGLMEWDVAVLIAGQDYREYRIDVNQPYADELVMTGAKFWYDNVLKNEVPPMDATEGAKKYLEERFPIENVSKGMLSAGEDAEGLFYSLLLARENETTATTQKKELENKLKALIGDYEGITFDRNGKILWKRARDREKIDWRGTAQDLEPDSQKLGHITHEHTETVQGSRTFRVTPPKE
jgi:predicted phage-related endonuclease